MCACAELARAHSAAQREGLLPKGELAALAQCVEALVGGNGRAVRRDARGYASNADVAVTLGEARLGPRDLEVAPQGGFDDQGGFDEGVDDGDDGGEAEGEA